MSMDKARAHLAKHGFEDRIIELEQSSATVALAAEALGCEPDHIAKTLSFAKDDGAILILAAGMARIDNAKFKACFGMKAKMLPAERVEEIIGHAVGGVCPFGVNEGIPVYLDESLKKYEIVYPAAGNDHSGVRLTVEELFAASEALDFVDVCK